MSEWRIQVVRVGPLEKHPNADTLLVGKVWDYPVIIKQGDLKEGDLAVYLMADSVVAEGDPRFAFLGEHRRIKARKLRGIFSMGLLTAAPEGVKEGNDMAAAWGITKYEPPEPMNMGGDNEKCPFDFPKYTDIESLRRWSDVLKVGEEVSITEKIHGTNMRAVWHDGRLWVGSHTSVKKRDEANLYWKAAIQEGLEEKLKAHPDVVLYGEIYGWVQDLRYGYTQGKFGIRYFDAMDLNTMRYLNFEAFCDFASEIGVKMVPSLYRGPWAQALEEDAEGDTMLNAKHVREGMVVKPVVERFDDRVGRCILKLHGQGYLVR
jgi:RNA ligase (TIGR02306 family)